MNPVVERMITNFKEMSRVKKAGLGLLAMVVVAGFTTMFIWANKTVFGTAYSGLTGEDAAAVVSVLKTNKIPYKLAGDGTTILVPESMVYDVRLTMAKEGIPKGEGVGYEIFDKPEFGTTEFVQKINKKRALQGELVKTIKAFEEVKNARVMIVLPKESVFVEEIKKPSASILLELNSDLNKEQVASIAHLVASSVQDLTPELVTIVDTTGRILFEGKSEEEQARIDAENLADAQYQYKVRFEENLSKRIQTMLERIVGQGKAIVRVTSEMDFSQKSMNQEIYDPFERGGEFVRSRKNRAEKIVQLTEDVPIPSTVNPITDENLNGQQTKERVNKSDDTYNYEISKQVLATNKPMAELTRLSVAAVIDGVYVYKENKDGEKQKVYQPRSAEEMLQFRNIVSRAMGQDEARGDQVSMECFPFASISELDQDEPEVTGWKKIQKDYGRLIANLILVVVLFLLVIRPIIKTVKDVKATVELEALPEPEAMEEEKDIPFDRMDAQQQQEYLESMSEEEKEMFLEQMSPSERNAYIANLSVAERARYYARTDLEKTMNILKVWASETTPPPKKKEEKED